MIYFVKDLLLEASLTGLDVTGGRFGTISKVGLVGRNSSPKYWKLLCKLTYLKIHGCRYIPLVHVKISYLCTSGQLLGRWILTNGYPIVCTILENVDAEIVAPLCSRVSMTMIHLRIELWLVLKNKFSMIMADGYISGLTEMKWRYITPQQTSRYKSWWCLLGFLMHVSSTIGSLVLVGQKWMKCTVSSRRKWWYY